MNVTTYKVPSTTFVPYSSVAKRGVIVIALPLAILTCGSGGTLTARSAQELSRWIYSPNINVEQQASFEIDTRSTAEHVAFIRDTFGLNMSELASILKVTRPTVYAWMEGQEPKTDALFQIRRFSRTAAEVQELRIPSIDKLVRRPVLGGYSLLDSLKANKDPLASLAMLKAFADKEMQARSAPKGSGKHKRTLDDVAAEYSAPSHIRS